jgi:hypothetical protein
MMRAWIDYHIKDIRRGLAISKDLVERIDIQMVYNTFGVKKKYSLEQAKEVFKTLYSSSQYKKMMKNGGFDVPTMLKMFKKHNEYYLIKGSWINNPKINKSYFSSFIKIEDDFAKNLRKIVLKNQ